MIIANMGTTCDVRIINYKHMKTTLFFPGIVVLLCLLIIPGRSVSQGTFFLDDNGITVKCPGVASGSKGTVQGIEYEAADNDLLRLHIRNESDLSRLCTSPVTSMEALFEEKFFFNEDIGSWDVSNVTNMRYMFSGAASFNRDISKWDTGNVITMGWMFSDAAAFNQDIGEWNVSQVNDMNEMFGRAVSFNQDISEWNVGNVIHMVMMFSGTISFNRDIGNWDVAGVINMFSMFSGAVSFNQDLGNWDTGNVTHMGLMFYAAHSFNQDIGRWDVGNVMHMNAMFADARAFNQDIGGWDVRNVTDMETMFAGAASFNQDLSSWCVEKITAEPANFSFSCPLSEENKPVWGSCPSGTATEQLHGNVTSFIMNQNFPNPFNPVTIIRFQLPVPSEVHLCIYTLSGQQVAFLDAGKRSAGWHEVIFEAAGLSSGVYIYRLQAGGYVESKKFTLIR